MLKLEVVSYDNAAPSAPSIALFGRERLTLGRGEDNFFVLADPNLEVARAQAALWHDGTRHRIVNLSDATPLTVNGQELRRDQEASLASGDQIRVGRYLIQAEVQPEPVPAASSDALALKEAFLRGAGIAPEAISADLTPQMMELIGKLATTSLQGTIDLLALRSLVKQEVKAEVTTVVTRNNNPLKFFPDSQTVLTQMLRKKMPGFMEPLEALEDASVDLRAHQMGIVAGMRANMQSMVTRVVSRLKPARFESHLGEPTLLDKLLPWRRQALMWQTYVEQHAAVAGEFQDQIKAVFGPAFLSAYEAEVERLSTRPADAAASRGQAARANAHAGAAK